MAHFIPIAVAAITGFTSGLILCIPVGLVNLTVINEGTRRGFAWAALIGVGATVMEVIYCAIAFTGFSSLFESRLVKASMEFFSFFFILYLAIKFMTAKSLHGPMSMGRAGDRFTQEIGGRLHPRSAFMIGFVRVLGNPGVLLGWIFLGTYFYIHGWVQPDWSGKVACVSGVAVATGTWFIFLSYAASRGKGKFSEKNLLRMEHYSGVFLLVLALFSGGHIIWQLAKHTI